MADSQTNSSADLHALAHVYPVADTDIHPVSDVHAGSDVHTVPDTEGRPDVHALPDLHTVAYVDTNTCTYCHSDTDADTDCDRANTYRDPADADACANGDTGTDG